MEGDDYMKVKISDIIVGRRIRKEYGDLKALAASIQRYTLLHPICIDKTNHLITGERRLKAHIELGRKEIEVKYLEDLSELERKEIELEENIQRESLTWQEEVEAKLILHELKQAKEGKRMQKSGGPGWAIRDTALLLDESDGTVSQDLSLAAAMRMFPSLTKEKNKSTAFKKYKGMQEGFLRAEVNRRRGKIVIPNIIHGDCVIETKKMKDNCFDMILADFPFGVDVEKSAGLGKHGKEDILYDDSPYDAMELLRKASKELYRVLKDDRHAMFFFAMDNYSSVKKILEEAGFVVEGMPLIWNKTSGSSAATGDNFPAAYEPIFWCRKGRRSLNSTICNVLTYSRVPPKKKQHPNEKPVPLLVALIEACTFSEESVYDPVAGGGSTLEASIEIGRECTVCEKNEMYYMRILEKFEKVKGRKVKEE